MKATTLLFILLVLAGCATQSPSLDISEAKAAAKVCEVNEDCTIRFINPGCCGWYDAYNKEANLSFVEEIADWQRKTEFCERAECAIPMKPLGARCVEKKCEAYNEYITQHCACTDIEPLEQCVGFDEEWEEIRQREESVACERGGCRRPIRFVRC